MKLEELVNRNYQQLNDNDLYIWNYIIHHRKECERLSIDELALRCSVSPVSYTHLDVYKRQIEDQSSVDQTMDI